MTVLSFPLPDESRIAPEQLLISALLESGQYNPHHYGVPDDAFLAFTQVHRFCLDYQATAGQAPPLELVLAEDHLFTHIPGIDVEWAAKQLKRQDLGNRTRQTLGKIASHAQAGNWEGAVEHMRQGSRTLHPAGLGPGTSLGDWKAIDAYRATSYCPIPPGTLASLTGGHPAGQLWYVAGMWSAGKSSRLIEHAVHAAENGWNVRFMSSEMSAEELQLKAFAVIGRDNPEPWELLPESTQRRLVDEWCERFPAPKFWGPGRYRFDPTVIGQVIDDEKVIVIVDMINRMYDTSGRMAREDWTVIAGISSELKQIASEEQVPVLVAAQLNRQGDLAGSVALEQDGDLIVAIDRPDKKVQSFRRNTLTKSRHTKGQGTQWFTRFDAGNGRFEEITSAEAFRLEQADTGGAW